MECMHDRRGGIEQTRRECLPVWIERGGGSSAAAIPL